MIELKAVEHAAKRSREALAGRDNAIRRAHQAGYSLREIAEYASLSHAGVKKIIERGVGGQ